jgi:hypothetical protein
MNSILTLQNEEKKNYCTQKAPPVNIEDMEIEETMFPTHESWGPLQAITGISKYVWVIN